jgi:hypothetical protein
VNEKEKKTQGKEATCLKKAPMHQKAPTSRRSSQLNLKTSTRTNRRTQT